MNNGLTIEQQFQMTVFEKQVKQLTREQAQEYLLEVLRQGMVKDNLFKDLIREYK
jgi:hypothetical protein